MTASRTGVTRCPRDVHALFHVRVPNPAPLGYRLRLISNPNWVKSSQRPHPAVTTQHFFRVPGAIICVAKKARMVPLK